MKVRVEKIGFLLLFAMTICFAGYAQDDAQFTLFPWATSYYNPGGIGEQQNTLCFTALYNNKYMGWKDVVNGTDSADKTGPQDVYLSAETYLKKIHSAFGITFIRDQLGFYTNTGAKLGYSYKLRIGGGHLGIGAQVSIFNQAIDKGGLHAIESGDPLLDQLDESTLDLDFSLGLMYKTDQWYAGIGVTQLAAPLDKDQKLRLSGINGSRRNMQLYFHGGYTWIVPANPNWEIMPQTMLKTDLATVQWDIMALARYNGVFWGGLGYRWNDAVSLVFGARPFYNSSNIYLKGLEAGLSYGITANKLAYRANRSFGDFEVMVRYCFDIYKPEIFSGYGSTRSIYKNQY